MLDDCSIPHTIINLQIIANDDVEGMYCPIHHKPFYDKEDTLLRMQDDGSYVCASNCEQLEQKVP